MKKTLEEIRIGILGPISWRTPPHHYGAWETVVHNLTEGLVARGFDVTLFATGDSKTSAQLRWVCPRPYSEDVKLDPKVWECLHVGHAFEFAGEFDIMHNHYDFLPLSYSRLTETPLLTTVHGFSSPAILPAYHSYKDTYFVSISDADRDPGLDYVATVYNGIDISQFTFNEKPDDFLVFLGRIHPDKGAHLAIELAKATGRRLVIAGIIQDQEYFDTLIEPEMSRQANIEYIGPVGPKERDELLGKSTALLHLVTIPERFGLTMAEAMACGTPVIGLDLGSVREVVDSTSGFVVKDMNEAIEAVGWLGQIDRRACRDRIERHFTADHMVENYIHVYREILEKEGIIEDSDGNDLAASVLRDCHL